MRHKEGEEKSERYRKKDKNNDSIEKSAGKCLKHKRSKEKQTVATGLERRKKESTENTETKDYGGLKDRQRKM
jgi:hypothetical protein